jgi:NAD(P)-dependent dehydrogenase (short-subunit alcohol dehydrogenase family)
VSLVDKIDASVRQMELHPDQRIATEGRRHRPWSEDVGKLRRATHAQTAANFIAATAKRFVEEGAFVYITGRRQTELDKAVSLIGRSVAAVQGDVSNLADLDRLYAKVASEKGKIDILFAGAGIVDPQLLAETTEESFDKVYAINTRGLAFTVKKALPLSE